MPVSMSRRRFLAQVSAGAAAISASRIARGAPGANDRISIGVIGCGDRGVGAHIAEITSLTSRYNVAVTAVCDVWKPNLDRAVAVVKKNFGVEPRSFTRFQELLALKDVDAVMIATPDFAHTPIMIEALKADKDVYVEKPMSLTIDEANEALDLARQRKRVVQVGTQRRSEGGMKAAAREVASGSLGTISRISAANFVNHPRWARPYDDCREQDVDWDAYLFNRPKRPFDPRLLRRWHLYRTCTNGLSGLWMAHFSDAVHFITGAKYPRAAVALGGIYVWKDGREHTDTFHALLDYPEGFLMDWAMGLANGYGGHFTVHGTKATLDINRLTVIAEDTKVQPRKLTPEKGENHFANWLECIRSRRDPNANIEAGHQHAVATIMAATALETGRRQVWDPEKRQMKGG